jgi:hypothetical protein
MTTFDDKLFHDALAFLERSVGYDAVIMRSIRTQRTTRCVIETSHVFDNSGWARKVLLASHLRCVTCVDLLSESEMKSVSFPAVRVTPEVRAEAEAVLQKGETLSNLLEQAVLAEIRNRRLKRAFLERGMAARANAAETGVYYSADDVIDRLDALLTARENET